MNSIVINGKSFKANDLLLDLLTEGISAVKPQKILHKFIKIKNEKLIIGNDEVKTTYEKINEIFPICIGKASVESAKTLIKIFEKNNFQLKKGVLVSNKENFENVSNFKCFISGHPLPNENGIKASNYIVKYLKKTKVDDLVLLFISGGGSALLPLPVKGITLDDKIAVNKKLIDSGANIDEINTVRKHLSLIKGGNFLKFCSPAKTHSLILSDVVGDNLSSISSGLTVPDPTTFRNTLNILKKFKIWSDIPESIKKYISDGVLGKNSETPKKNDEIFKNSKHTIIGSNSISLKRIKNLCEKRKIKSKIWKKNIEGNVEKVALEFVNSIKSMKRIKQTLLISGGETTVKIKGDGKGGRNQEFALHFIKYVKKILPNLNYTFLSAGTDGRDGPTDAAGAIIDQNSQILIKKLNINLTKELKNNNSYYVLKQIKSLVIINGTNTNVADIQLLAIME